MKIGEYRNYIFDFYGTLADIWTDESDEEFWFNFARYLREKGAGYNRKGVRNSYLAICGSTDRRMKKEQDYELIEIDILEVFDELYRRKGIEAHQALLISTAEQFR